MKKHNSTLIFWGSKWRPYSESLRETVFARQDIADITSRFTLVHLDGDAPGAQARAP